MSHTVSVRHTSLLAVLWLPAQPRHWQLLAILCTSWLIGSPNMPSNVPPLSGTASAAKEHVRWLSTVGCHKTGCHRCRSCCRAAARSCTAHVHGGGDHSWGYMPGMALNCGCGCVLRISKGCQCQHVCFVLLLSAVWGSGVTLAGCERVPIECAPHYTDLYSRVLPRWGHRLLRRGVPSFRFCVVFVSVARLGLSHDTSAITGSAD